MGGVLRRAGKLDRTARRWALGQRQLIRPDRAIQWPVWIQSDLYTLWEGFDSLGGARVLGVIIEVLKTWNLGKEGRGLGKSCLHVSTSCECSNTTKIYT